MIKRKPNQTEQGLALVVMALVLANVQAHALDNPGFEVPDKGAGGWEYAPAGASWTFTAAKSGLSGPNGPWKCSSTSPDPLGDQFGFLQDVSTISQGLSNLATGTTYTLSFYESYRTAMSPSNDLNVVLDAGLGTEVTIYTNAGVSNPTWEARQTAEFVATKASYTLTFRTTNPLGGDRSTLIDGVKVNAFASPGPPTVSSLSPADEALGVRVDTDLVVSFSEYVRKGTGNIEITEYFGDAVLETIDVTSASVTVDGVDVTINPTNDLALDTAYYVEIDSGAIEDLSGDPFAGISGKTTWDFATAAETSISYHPITGDADSDISINKTYTHKLDFGTGTPGALINGVQFAAYNNAANGTLQFNRTVSSGNASDHPGNGNHNVSGALANLLTDMYYNGNCVPGGTTTWTVSGLFPGFVYDTRIYVRQWEPSPNRLVTLVFDPDGPGLISDSTGLISEDQATSVGMAADNDAYYINYRFTAVGHDLVITATQNNNNSSWHLYGLTNEEVPPPDTTAPTVTDLDPTDDASGVLVVRDLVVTFDEDVVAGPGNITVTNLTAATGIVIAASNAQVTVAGPVLTINPTADLAPTNDYAVLIDTNAIKDLAGNPFAGIADSTNWNFSTAALDVNAPTFTTLIPADDADDMSTGADLVITFDEDVRKGTGNIQIKLTADDTVFETIDVASAAVTVNGAEVTINPAGNLAVATGYYVEIAPGAIEDISRNDFAGITGNSTWNFTTLDAGVISYHQITDDADSGIVSNRVYTHAIDFGSAGTATVNGVVFGTDVNVAAGGRANSGARTYGPNPHAGTPPPAVTGGITNLFRDFRFNGPDLGYVELTGLTPGNMYDLRFYDRAWDYEAHVRTYYAGYDLGGDGSVEFTTPKIDQNRATLVPPWLSSNVSWAVSYVYRADASGKIRVIIDLADDSTGTYHLYGLTNEELPADGSIYWIGAGASNVTPTSVCVYATVNTNLDEAVLVWDTSDRGAGNTNDWTNSVSLGAWSPGVVTGEVTNLLPDTRYSFRFYGTSSLPTNGWSAAAAFATAFSAAQTPVFTHAATSAWNAITLDWQDNASNETGYILQRSTTGSGGPYGVIATLRANVTSYWELVPRGITYHYRLAATNAANGSATDFAACETRVIVPPVLTFQGVLFRDDFSETDATFNQNVEDNLSLFGSVVGSMTPDGPTYTTSGAIGGENGNATWRVGGPNSSAFIPNYDFALNVDLTNAAWFTVSLKDLTPGGGWAALAVFDDQALSAGPNVTEQSVGLGALFGPGPGGAIQVWSHGNMATNPVTTPAPPFDVTIAVTNISGFGLANSFDYEIMVNSTPVDSGTKTNINTTLNCILVEGWKGTSTVGELEVRTAYVPDRGTLLIVR